MQTDYLRDLRYKLQKRVRQLNAASPEHFLDELERFWKYFDSVPTLKNVTTELSSRFPNIHGEVNVVLQGTHRPGKTEEEHAAIGHGVLRQLPGKGHYYLQIGPNSIGKSADMLDELRATYLEPFYQYVDEHLDDWSFFAAMLLRYKRSCEWYRREKLYDLWSNSTRNGERLLSLDLHGYLYDKGIEFYVEPSSASGEADVVSAPSPNDSFIIEVKVFNADKGRGVASLKSGLRQIHQYTWDYNRGAGYLVIFNTSPAILRLTFSPTADPFPRVEFNNKTFFIAVIDIFPHQKPASQRPAADLIEITEQEAKDALALPA